jgi:Flp pilus assembly protein TadG
MRFANRALFRTKRFRRGGTATLEMALTMLLLANICYGTIEFGYYFFVKNTVIGASREGCRASIVAGAVYSDITTAVNSSLQAAGLSIGQFTTTVQVTHSGGSAQTINNLSTCVAGDTMSVTVSANWGTVGSGFRPMGLIGANKVVTASSVMRKEG